jgi:hypothetical protein
MSKLHVLTGNNNNQYQIIVHIATPVGNNAAGVAWSQAVINSGRNVTSMPIGNGPGQIAQSEADQITAGTLLESSQTYWDDITLNTTQRLAALDAVATQMGNDAITNCQTQLKFYGMTRT